MVWLKIFGFCSYDKPEKKKQYTEIHGDIDDKMREKNRKLFNEDKNIHGDYIKIMLLSQAATEGISLMNVRQVHILEPYWQEVRMKQVVGRAIRDCSHKLLDKKDRHVDVFRYKTTIPNKTSMDELIYYVSMKKDGLNSQFLEAIQESAIDCVLNNKNNDSGKCFSFDLKSQIENVGPAYFQDITLDIFNNKGLNYDNIVDIKCYKVNIVFHNIKNEKTKGWFHPETRYVFHEKMKYPIGKVDLNDDGFPEMTENAEYIVKNHLHVYDS